MTDETEELHRDWDSVKTSKKLLTPDLYFVRPKTGKDGKKDFCLNAWKERRRPGTCIIPLHNLYKWIQRSALSLEDISVHHMAGRRREAWENQPAAGRKSLWGF